MKANKKLFKTGDTVRSRYRAPWIGVVRECSTLPDGDGHRCHWVYEVLPLIDKRGNPIRKPRSRRLDGSWLSLSEPKLEPPDRYLREVRLVREEANPPGVLN